MDMTEIVTDEATPAEVAALLLLAPHTLALETALSHAAAWLPALSGSVPWNCLKPPSGCAARATRCSTRHPGPLQRAHSSQLCTARIQDRRCTAHSRVQPLDNRLDICLCGDAVVICDLDVAPRPPRTTNLQPVSNVPTIPLALCLMSRSWAVALASALSPQMIIQYPVCGILYANANGVNAHERVECARAADPRM